MIENINLQAGMVQFLMAIDADTRVDVMSITHIMVYAMDKKGKVLALCGETNVDNKCHISDACWTIFLSQRHRWINSTLHNV